MQLDSGPRLSPLRARLAAAACLLLASALPLAGRAQSGATAANPGVARQVGPGAAGTAPPAATLTLSEIARGSASNQLDTTFLIYGEEGRTNVFEPSVRVTRLYPDGQSLSAQLDIDVMTGASPTGAMPSGKVQTTTTPSGNVRTTSAAEIPVASFNDVRGALEANWHKPLWGRLSATTGAHYSREKDYQSLGLTEKLSVDVMDRLATLTIGGSLNHDLAMPVGGTPVGLSDSGVSVGDGSESKEVSSALVGVSRVLSRRWIMSLNASHTWESGYLTEPYKVVSTLDPDAGTTTGQLTELRPSAHDRSNVLANSVYHLSRGVLYSSYRYYWDDWGVRSHTLDLKVRRDLANGNYLQPHVRLYTQTAADFFTFGLTQGTPLPAHATSDYRLGPLRSVTLGGTFGFHTSAYPGQFILRGEYIRQWGDGHPPDAVGAQQQLDLFPPVGIVSVVVGYSVGF